jgi:CHASE3 domain sensor protein
MGHDAESIDFRAKLRRLLLVPVAALVLLAGLLGLGLVEQARSARLVDHADQVIAAADRLQTLMLDEETGVRGYLLSQDASALEPWNSAQGALKEQFQDLANLVNDNPAQEQRLEKIRVRHEAWQAFSKQKLVATSAPNSSAGDVLAGKRQMDAIRYDVNGFVASENQLRAVRKAGSDWNLRFLLISLGAMAVFFGGALAWWLFRSMAALDRRNEEQVATAYRERQWLQTTLRAVGDGVIATDAEGRVIFLNGDCGGLHRMDGAGGQEPRAARDLPHCE